MQPKDDSLLPSLLELGRCCGMHVMAWPHGLSLQLSVFVRHRPSPGPGNGSVDPDLSFDRASPSSKRAFLKVKVAENGGAMFIFARANDKQHNYVGKLRSILYIANGGRRR